MRMGIFVVKDVKVIVHTTKIDNIYKGKIWPSFMFITWCNVHYVDKKAASPAVHSKIKFALEAEHKMVLQYNSS